MRHTKTTLLSPGMSTTDARLIRNAYIVLSGNAGRTLGNVFVGYCPLAAIDVDDQVDYTVVNALNNDLYISTFGYAPVVIQLSGLEVQNGLCQDSGKIQKKSFPDIASFFADNNVYKNKRARVDISIRSANGNSAAYRCVVVSLKRAGDGHSKAAGELGYELKLLGVRL